MQQSNVFLVNRLLVIGPTPPGTGVIALQPLWHFYNQHHLRGGSHLAKIYSVDTNIDNGSTFLNHILVYRAMDASGAN